MNSERLSSLLNLPSPLQPFPNQSDDSPVIHIKRDDQIHATLSGNKFRKLTGHLKAFKRSGKQGIVTMGGPWSNHLHATAWVCRELDIPCRFIIRGPEPMELSLMLEEVVSWGAKLCFISRSDYRQLRQDYEASDELSKLILEFAPHDYFIPEGGRAIDSSVGLQTLANELQHDYAAVYMAVGTGSTIAGLVKNWTNPDTQFHGVLAVDAQQSQRQTINLIAPQGSRKITLRDKYLFGGYAIFAGIRKL